MLEVGGLMAYGEALARQWRIRAIVGVDRGAMRLHAGDRIRIQFNNATKEMIVPAVGIEWDTVRERVFGEFVRILGYRKRLAALPSR